MAIIIHVALIASRRMDGSDQTLSKWIWLKRLVHMFLFKQKVPAEELTKNKSSTLLQIAPKML